MAYGTLRNVFLALLTLSPVAAVYTPEAVSDQPIAVNRGYVVEFAEPQGSNVGKCYSGSVYYDDLLAALGSVKILFESL